MRTLLIIIFLGALLGGCAASTQKQQPYVPEYEISVDSIKSPKADAKYNYIILPGNDNTSANDLVYNEFAGYIISALSAQGYSQAKTENDADILIILRYGISEPQQQVETGPSPLLMLSDSQAFRSLGLLGALDGPRTTTYYHRFIVLDAIDLNEYKISQNISPLWKTTITSIGTSGDLRQLFPIMVAASSQHIATNSTQQIQVVIRDDDPRIKILKH